MCLLCTCSRGRRTPDSEQMTDDRPTFLQARLEKTTSDARRAVMLSEFGVDREKCLRLVQRPLLGRIRSEDNTNFSIMKKEVLRTAALSLHCGKEGKRDATIL